MSQPPPSAGAPGDKKEAPKKKRTTSSKRGEAKKIRVKLPSIETFQKEVSFKLDGPGRVVVRLERLMGSDRVRLTDPKFMSTLLERLEEEENSAWLKRTKLRKKNERNRSRHLAIEGLMDPGDDMQDLIKHPVFRVNRVLKRLSRFDQAMSHGQEINLAPIVTTEPFEEDDTGEVFKAYPGHTRFTPKKKSQALSAEEEEEQPEVEVPIKIQVEQVDFDEEEEEDEEEASAQPPATSEEPKADEETAVELTYEYPEEWDGEGAPPLALSQVRSLKAAGASLTAIQESYGINQDEDLMAAWEPFRSQLVDLMFSGDTEKMAELYNTARDVLGVYTRESLSADNFVKKIQRYLGMNDSKD